MLELKNIKKSFSGRKILDGISLKVTDGEIMCIVGQSGGGKTTLLRCISGLERIDEGEMMLDGRKFDPMSSKEALIGVVFQEYNLFPHLSVLENVTLAPKIALKKDPQAVEKEARQLLKKLSLEGKENLIRISFQAVKSNVSRLRGRLRCIIKFCAMTNRQVRLILG